MSAYGGFALKAMQDYFAGKTVKALLVGTTYVQDVDAHVYLSNLPAGTEITPSGSYAAGGVTVTGLAVSYDATTDTVKVDCDDIVFPVVAGPTDVAGVLYYVSTGVAGTSQLLGYDDFAAPVTLTNQILTHQPSVDGIFTAAVQP